MKQYIELEQIAELSSKARQKLHLWLLEHDYHTVVITLGILIEFLGDHTNGIYSYPVMEDDGEKYLESKYINGNKIEELCDWLWEATKEVLEKEV